MRTKTNTYWPKCAGKEATDRQSSPEEAAAGNQSEVLEAVWPGWTPGGWRVRYGCGQIRGELIEADFWGTGRSFVLDLGRQVDEAVLQSPCLRRPISSKTQSPRCGGLLISWGAQDTTIKEPLASGGDPDPAVGDLIPSHHQPYPLLLVLLPAPPPNVVGLLAPWRISHLSRKPKDLAAGFIS